MNILRRLLLSANFTKHYHKMCSIYKNSAKASFRNMHINTLNYAKIFQEFENNYAYNIMESQGYVINLLKTSGSKKSLSELEFSDILQQDWSESNRHYIFEIFPILGTYSSDHNLCISNQIFDAYIDKLTDNIKYATDCELIDLFYSLKKWPPTKSVGTRNFIEVWAALDDACLRRTRECEWSFDEMLKYLSLFFMINVTKLSEYSMKSIQRLTSKAKQLNPSQIVQTLFFIGLLRKSPFDMHNLEVELKNQFDNFTIDELAIISMGFFKSKTPIRDSEISVRIIDKIIANSKVVHEVTLATLMKIVRYSLKITRDDSVYRVLDVLQHEVPRLSIMCNIHIALLGTSTLTFHRECLNKIADNINNNMSKTRLKDIERLLLTFGTFLFIPDLKDKSSFIDNVLQELRKPERNIEIQKYGRSFACSIGYLILLEVYPSDLISYALRPEFLHNTYGSNAYSYGREILCLHNTAQIFMPSQPLSGLQDKFVSILAKKYTDYMPSEEYPKQYNVTEKMILEVMGLLAEDRGGKQFVLGDHILTHHQRGDVILCEDANGQPAPVPKFDNKNFGQVRLPPTDGNIWIVLVIAGRNCIIKNYNQPVGQFVSKVKELRKLGYRAELVLWTEYTRFEMKEDKLNYLKHCYEKALKC